MSVIARIRRQHYLCALLLVAGCRDLVDPPLPSSAVVLVPPAVYSTWWSMTEACSGLHAPLSTVTWYVVPDVAAVSYKGLSDVDGYWSLASNEIVLAGDAALNGGTVRHEMLHALLRRGNHPRAAFLGACGGVVDCGAACVADAGPPAPLDLTAPRVSEYLLDVAVSVAPVRPSTQIDSGFFTVTVHVTNPFPTPVIVTLPHTGSDGTGPTRSFSYTLSGPAGGIEERSVGFDPAETRFAAHQTKEQVFDLIVTDSATPAGPAIGLPVSVAAGSYLVKGGYGNHWATDTVQIGP